MKARVPNGMGKGPSNNMNQMLKQAQKMQDQITALQADLEQREFKGSAGGGVVKVVMNGDKGVQSLTIAKEAVDPEDVEMLQDLISAAVNECMKKVDEMMTSEMSKLTSGLGLPPGII